MFDAKLIKIVEFVQFLKNLYHCITYLSKTPLKQIFKIHSNNRIKDYYIKKYLCTN